MINALQANRIMFLIGNQKGKLFLLTSILREVETQAKAGHYSLMISEDTEDKVLEELRKLGFKVEVTAVEMKELTWGDAEGLG